MLKESVSSIVINNRTSRPVILTEGKGKNRTRTVQSKGKFGICFRFSLATALITIQCNGVMFYVTDRKSGGKKKVGKVLLVPQKDYEALYTKQGWDRNEVVCKTAIADAKYEATLQYLKDEIGLGNIKYADFVDAIVDTYAKGEGVIDMRTEDLQNLVEKAV